MITSKQAAAITTGVGGVAPALLPPGMFAAPTPAAPEPLTRNQLVQAFNYLLRNDPERQSARVRFRHPNQSHSVVDILGVNYNTNKSHNSCTLWRKVEFGRKNPIFGQKLVYI